MGHGTGPLKIDIPGELAAFAVELDKITNWAEICKAREETARKANATGNT